MCHRKIRIPKDTAIEIMEVLGNIDDAIQFDDLNKNDFSQRSNYLTLINRCEEADKRIFKFMKICELYNQPVNKYNCYQAFAKDLEDDKKFRLVK